MFVVGIIFALIALVALLMRVFAREKGARSGGFALFALALLLSVGSIVIASLSTVPTRNVGIVTQFGKPTGRTTGAGLQWTPPWQDVQDWDATGQVYDHSNEKSCVSVRIAGGGTGCVEVTVEWRAGISRSPENFALYREVGDASRFDVFADRRVNRQITAALASLFAGFDPLSTVSSSTGLAAAPDLNSLYKQKLTDAINLSIGGGVADAAGKVTVAGGPKDNPNADVVVRSATFGYIHYDDATNAKLTSYGQKLLDQRNLQVDKANADLREQIAAKSGVPAAVQQCLDLVKTLGRGEPGLCMGAGVALTKPVS